MKIYCKDATHLNCWACQHNTDINSCNSFCKEGENFLLKEDLKNVSVIEVRPVIFAKFIIDNVHQETIEGHCSNCSQKFAYWDCSPKYCPICGAEWKFNN